MYSPNTFLKLSETSPTVQKLSTAWMMQGIRFSPERAASSVVWRAALDFYAVFGLRPDSDDHRYHPDRGAVRHFDEIFDELMSPLEDDLFLDTFFSHG